MKSVVTIGIAAAMLLSMAAPVFAQNESAGLNTNQTVQMLTGDPSNESAGLNTNQTVQQIVSAPSPSQNESAGLNTNQTVQQIANGQTNNGNTTGPDDIGCSVTSGQGIAICLSNLVYYPMVGLGSWFAYIGAFIFSYAVVLALSSASYALDFIATSWQVVRDIANMGFLFVLVYIGYKIIFGAETAGTMRLLSGIVVVALLVNFSFVMTRMMIDAGNILAVQFYNAIGGPNAQTIGQTAANSGTLNIGAISASQFATAGGAKDLTASIMNALQLQSITGSQSFQAYAKGETGANASPSFMYTLITLSVIYFATGIILFILAGSFLYAGAKFIIRTVGLWFVIIFSPIAFVAAIFYGRGTTDSEKKTGSLFGTWLTYLFKYSLYPGVFLFMWWVMSVFATQMGNNLIQSIYTANAPTANAGAFSIIAIAIANVGVRLGFIIAMIYITLSLADKLDGYSAGVAGWFQRSILSGAAGGIITRPSAWLNRTVAPALQSRLPTAAAVLDRVGYVGSRADIRNIPGIGAPLRGVTTATKKLSDNFGTLAVDYAPPANRAQPKRIPFPTRTAQQQPQAGQQTQQGAQAQGTANAQAQRQEPTVPNYQGTAAEPRVHLPGSRGAEDLPPGARIEPRVPTRSAPEVHLNVSGTLSSQKAIEELTKQIQQTREQAQQVRAAGNVLARSINDISAMRPPPVVNPRSEWGTPGGQPLTNPTSEWSAPAPSTSASSQAAVDAFNRQAQSNRQAVIGVATAAAIAQSDPKPQARPATEQREIGEVKEAIQGLSKQVAQASAAVKTGGPMPKTQKVEVDYNKIKSIVKKAVRDYTPQPPTGGARGAAAPAQQQQTNAVANENVPFSEAAE